MDAQYASKGVAGAGLGLGIAGTALALLQGGGLGGLLGGGWGCGGCAGGAALAAGGVGLAAIAEKDATIAQLRSELDTDRKLIQVWDNLNTKRETSDMKIASLEATVAGLNQVLNSITKVVVPIGAVCPQPMPQHNSWVAPTATTTTTTSSVAQA